MGGMPTDYRFDEQDPACQRPCGAVPAGQGIEINVQVARRLGAGRVCLVLAADGEEPRAVAMPWVDTERGWDRHRCVLHDLPVGLYWYWFAAEVSGEERPLGKDAPCQLTVYQADYRTPEWFDGGVTYHIFVDRFHRVGEMPTTRPLRAYEAHRSWEESPNLYPKSLLEQNYDFFGGNLAGIRAKLSYLESLGVTTLYLSPLFESFSNHRYDTGDFHRIDPLVGDEEEFCALCAEAAERGMAVVLDMVFNHTGSDSRYFNNKGRYDSLGAAQSQDSPYAGWYFFDHWPDQYASWWGVMTLPTVNKENEDYIAFTLTGENSVVRHWLRAGASGYRLDVVDELPQSYVERLRQAVKEMKPNAVVIGEVWEDASNKTSYGHRRRYFQGRELDGVTNYPARDAILGFLRGSVTAGDAARTLRTLHHHYPPPARRCLMNILGTHDTTRVLNLLGCDDAALALPPPEKAAYVLSDEERQRGTARLRQAAALQYLLPGSPCVYYGDEVGLDGFEDPMNRRPFPWGREDGTLLAWYRALGGLRRGRRALFADGDLRVSAVGDRLLLLTRATATQAVVAAVNAGEGSTVVRFPWSMTLLLGDAVPAGEGRMNWTLPGGGVAIFGWEEPHDS